MNTVHEVTMFRLLVVSALLAPVAAFACPGSSSVAQADGPADPTACARNAALVGSGCTWSTSAMAQRVNTEGRAAAVTARLVASKENLASEVAAPYRAGEFYVIANQVIERADPTAVLSMTGKMLEVEGVKYFLVTGFRTPNS